GRGRKIIAKRGDGRIQRGPRTTARRDGGAGAIVSEKLAPAASAEAGNDLRRRREERVIGAGDGLILQSVERGLAHQRIGGGGKSQSAAGGRGRLQGCRAAGRAREDDGASGHAGNERRPEGVRVGPV